MIARELLRGAADRQQLLENATSTLSRLYASGAYAPEFAQALKVDGATANILVAISLLVGTPFFIVFGSLSDKIGRKPIIMAGCLIAALTYFPLFKALTETEIGRAHV